MTRELVHIEDQVIAALRRINRAIDLHSRSLLQKHGLTTPQLAAIRLISQRGPITTGEVAKALRLSPATINGILNRLENRDLLRRSRNPSDRRAVNVELTEQGFAALEQAPSLLQDRFRDELARLAPWERTQMLAVLQRIATMMDAEDIEAVPILTVGDASAPAEAVSEYLAKAVTIPEK